MSPVRSHGPYPACIQEWHVFRNTKILQELPKIELNLRRVVTVNRESMMEHPV